MKKILSITLIVFILVSSSVLAAMPPWPSYCEHQSYVYEYDQETGQESCVFDNGEKCDAKVFFDGTCGQEHVKEIPCRKEGEFVFSQFEECCEGLEPFTKIIGQPYCVEKLNFFQKIWQWIISIF